MNPRLSPLLAIFGVAFLLWGGTTFLTTKLVPYREKDAPPVRGASADLHALEEQVSRAPDDLTLRLALAAMLHRQAQTEGSAALLMRAVEQYSVVLTKEPENSTALLGIARVCLDSGLFNQAAEYFRKHLAKHPNDVKTRVDLALTLIQAERPEEAERELVPLLEKNPALFQARLALALTYRVAGRLDDARREATHAATNAPDQTATAAVNDFLAGLDRTSSGGTPATSENQAQISPAMTIEKYFREHKILAPKIVSITWPQAAVCQINVKDFPVENMPAFARQRFLQNAEDALRAIPERIKIDLVAEETKRSLLQFEVGTDAG